MKIKQKKQIISVRLNVPLLAHIQSKLPLTDFSNRTQLIQHACEFYLASLEAELVKLDYPNTVLK